MVHLLMPKATATWLVENTALTFVQIADFCQLHHLEVQSIADGDTNIQGVDPIAAGQLSWDEIHRCEADGAERLVGIEKVEEVVPERKKRNRYIPIAKRSDKPSAILWLVKNHPELSDAQIVRLLGTTRATITSIRNRTHKESMTLRAQNPVNSGVCSEEALQAEIAEAAKHGHKAHEG
jgi:hypothetical protein